MLRCKRAIASILSIQSTFNAWAYCRSFPYLWCIWYLSTLRNFLYGKYHGCKSITNCSMVHANGIRRLYHLNLWRFHSPSPLRNSPYHNCRYSMDHCTPPLRHRTRRCKLLGLHFPIHDLRNSWRGYHIQSHKHLHHYISSAEPTRIGGWSHHALTSSWNCCYAWICGYC